MAPWKAGSAWQRAWLQIGRAVRPLGAKAAVRFILCCGVAGVIYAALGPSPLLFEQISLQRSDPIAQIIHALRRDDMHLAVWGYMPKYYAITGLRPATRDAITHYEVWENPQIEYYRKRYLSDFNKSRPNVLVQATRAANFSLKNLPPMPIERFPEFSEIVRSNYYLLLDIQPCGTPRTRIYVSQKRFSGLKPRAKALAKVTSCLWGDEDLSHLLSSLS